MWRLSRLVEGKSDEVEVDGGAVCVDKDEDGFFRADFRGLEAW